MGRLSKEVCFRVWEQECQNQQHGWRRSRCKGCGAASICQHGRQRHECSRCKDCRAIFAATRKAAEEAVTAETQATAAEDAAATAKAAEDAAAKEAEDAATAKEAATSQKAAQKAAAEAATVAAQNRAEVAAESQNAPGEKAVAAAVEREEADTSKAAADAKVCCQLEADALNSTAQERANSNNKQTQEQACAPKAHMPAPEATQQTAAAKPVWTCHKCIFENNVTPNSSSCTLCGTRVQPSREAKVVAVTQPIPV